VLDRRLLLTLVHLLADLQRLSLARLEGGEPLVLQLDELLFALRELLVAVREAAFHRHNTVDCVREGALPLGRKLLSLDERLDLPFGLLHVIHHLGFEVLQTLLGVLDRLLPFG